jgi:glycosyltransferase involved in cell wall biosynthesis
MVVPAYNNADFLAATLRSIVDQSYRNLEIIVSDHSSTDATAEVMQQFADDERVTLLTTEAGGGALRNWNRVSQAASGKYLKLVCGDDIVYPSIVADQVAALEQNEGAVLTASQRDIVDARGVPVVSARGLGRLFGRHRGLDAVRTTIVQGTNIFGEPACVLMRRDALERAGWWDSRYPYLIDQASYARVLAQGDFVGLRGARAAFRISQSQWSVRLVKDQAQQAIGFHEWARTEWPDSIGAGSVAVGNLRARLMARARRLTYIYLGRRMAAAEASDQPQRPAA